MLTSPLIVSVFFGNHEIRTWYYSPYPFDEEEWALLIGSQAGPSSSSSSASDAAGAAALRVGGPSAAANKTGGARGDLAPAAAHAMQQQHIAAGQGLGQDGGSTLQVPQQSHGQTIQGAREASAPPMAKALWICDGCFKYMRTYPGFRAHKKQCTFSHPPGRKVYQRGAHTIWEVDGAEQKLYAQNLSLFGKLFIDHKTIYFDVEPFLFYVLTDASPQFDHVLGFFSKEKVSYDDYNLACIVTLPPAQKKGFGTLMIEFSYYLSALAQTKDCLLGTPERPLSDLGLQGYLSYWSSVALRALAIIFNDCDADVRSRLLPATYDLDAPARSRFHAQTTAATAALAEERLREECLRMRRALLGLAPPRKVEKGRAQRAMSGTTMPSTSDEAHYSTTAATRRGMKGWAGEVPRLRPTGSRQSAGHGADDSSSPSTSANDGSSSQDTQLQVMASAHPLLQVNDAGQVVPLLGVETSLERLAQAVNLRMDDLCFALSECGLLRRKIEVDEEREAAALVTGADDMELDAVTRTEDKQNDPRKHVTSVKEQAMADVMVLVLTRDDVRDAMRRMQVKRPIFDVRYARV